VAFWKVAPFVPTLFFLYTFGRREPSSICIFLLEPRVGEKQKRGLVAHFLGVFFSCGELISLIRDFRIEGSGMKSGLLRCGGARPSHLKMGLAF